MNRLNLSRYFRKYAFLYFIAVIAVLASTILDMVAPLIVQHIVDDVLIARNLAIFFVVFLNIFFLGF